MIIICTRSVYLGTPVTDFAGIPSILYMRYSFYSLSMGPSTLLLQHEPPTCKLMMVDSRIRGAALCLSPVVFQMALARSILRHAIRSDAFHHEYLRFRRVMYAVLSRGALGLQNA